MLRLQNERAHNNPARGFHATGAFSIFCHSTHAAQLSPTKLDKNASYTHHFWRALSTFD